MVSRFDVGEPDLWDEVDEAIDRIQEPLVPELLNASEES